MLTLVIVLLQRFSKNNHYFVTEWQFCFLVGKCQSNHSREIKELYLCQFHEMSNCNLMKQTNPMITNTCTFHRRSTLVNLEKKIHYLVTDNFILKGLLLES